MVASVGITTYMWVRGALRGWWHRVWIQVREVQTKLGYPGGHLSGTWGDGHQELRDTRS